MIFDKDKIQKITLFENLTNAKVKDFLDEEDKIVIIIENGDLGKAIGREGKNIKMVENLMKKRLKIIEFNQDPLKFVKNFIYPIKPENIALNDDFVEIKSKDRKSKGLLIGRERKNLNDLGKLLKGYFNINVRVL
jgi:N utilization substance protein A